MTGVIRKIKGKECYFLDGKEVTKKVFNREMDKARPKVKGRFINKRLKRGYPYESMAIACHPDDVKKAEAFAVKLGVPTEYKSNGSAVVRDAGHRRKLLKAMGLRDRNSYNGY